ncbi:hypothetical protein ACLBKS_02200 [Hylemonella sp. W303a]|uniref:hypothetical protein n=1 Tax=Hylemonella sp. W303a TaxID=3389873 RepID=UPI00396B3E12
MTEILFRLAALSLALILVAGSSWWAGVKQADGQWLRRQAKAAQDAAAAIQQERERGEKSAHELNTQLAEQRNQFKLLEGRYLAYTRSNPIVLAQNVGSAPDPAITAGAAWLWNEILEQHDELDISACGTSAGTDTTCQTESEFTLSDAWNNHFENARICTENRIRHQKLIDYIKQVQNP